MENNFTDDADIKREVKCLYTCTNILIRRFKRYSVGVKTVI